MAKRKIPQPNTDEQHELAVKTFKYILNASTSKIPIKKSDIIKNVLNGNGDAFDMAFREASDHLSNIYGFRLHETDTCKTNKQYICVSKFPAASLSEFKASERQNLGLLYIVLAYIFMKGGSISEVTLWEFLRSLNIYQESVHHHFGTVKTLLNETFVKQLYLARVKSPVEALAEEKISFSWGIRAVKEFDQKNLFYSVAKLLNKPPDSFAQQYIETHGCDESMDNSSLID